MEENDSLNLDLEYKRYLQILRPYLEQLIDDDVIEICNAWIQRLSKCDENEKTLRNKYVFSLCYQLAKGTLEDPFLKYPSGKSLSPISESIVSDDSSTEVECYVVNAEDPNTDVLFNSNQPPLADTEHLSKNIDLDDEKGSHDYDSDGQSNRETSKRVRKHSVMCYTGPEFSGNLINCDPSEVYEHRANNLIKKLRDIKTQNVALHNELMALREESIIRHNNSFADSVKVDHATSAILQSNESNATLKSLKFNLQEVQESRNNLIDKVSSLQDQLDNFNEMKKNEIEDIEAKHKMEIIEAKKVIREEMKNSYEKKLEDMKLEYELKLDSLQNKSSQDIMIISTTKNDLIEEKNKLISTKDKEIVKLNYQVDDLKNHLHAVLEKFIDKPSINCSGEDSLKYKAEQLERRLNRMEKSKIKCTKIYEAKVAQLQREKHLAECSLQLQMVRQRAQVVNEVTDENQAELTTALDKLETKYKDIVANVQATAIQRRMQDQMALESILQTACGIPTENNSTNANRQFAKTMRSQNLGPDGGMSPLSRRNKVGNTCFDNKSFGDDNLVTGYCLNGERMGELFERVYIPQRDDSDAMK